MNEEKKTKNKRAQIDISSIKIIFVSLLTLGVLAFLIIIVLSSLSSDSSSSSVICYQETANVSTSCGGLSSGVYSLTQNNWTDNGTATYDGDFDTFSENVGSFDLLYVNYTIPSSTAGAVWRIKDGEGEFNLTLPSECLSGAVLRLIVTSSGADSEVIWSCFDYDSDMESILRTMEDSQQIYEEGVYWDITSEDSTGTQAYSPIEKNITNSVTLFFANSSTWFYLLALVIVLLILALVISIIYKFRASGETSL